MNANHESHCLLGKVFEAVFADSFWKLGRDFVWVNHSIKLRSWHGTEGRCEHPRIDYSEVQLVKLELLRDHLWVSKVEVKLNPVVGPFKDDQIKLIKLGPLLFFNFI